MARRPNILFVMADQLAPQVLPAYGHARAQTPNLDRLAAEGVVFENAYCNFPLCAPARRSMLSGSLPLAHRRVRQRSRVSRLCADLPALSAPCRLPTCLAGKMHFVGPDQLHGYEERITTDVYPADFLWSRTGGSTGRAGSNGTTACARCSTAGRTGRSVHIAYDDEVEFEAYSLLHEHGDGGDGRPFALTVSFISPHDPYLAPPGLVGSGTATAEIDAPQVPEHPPERNAAPQPPPTGSSPGATARRSARRTCCACATPTMR